MSIAVAGVKRCGYTRTNQSAKAGRSTRVLGRPTKETVSACVLSAVQLCGSPGSVLLKTPSDDLHRNHSLGFPGTYDVRAIRVIPNQRLATVCLSHLLARKSIAAATV